MKKSNILYVASYKEIQGVINPVRKVGITGGGNSDTKSRMRILSNGTEAYSEIEAIQAWELPGVLPAQELEDHLHQLFDILNLRTNREWFNGGSGDHNIIEELVEKEIRFLISKGFEIKALHEFSKETDILDENNEKIKIKANKTQLPYSVKINGSPITFSSFADILRETFKVLVDSNKIRVENIPHSKNNSRKYIISNSPINEDESEFLNSFEYKGLFLETHGNAKTMIENSRYLIDNFGEGEFILKIE